MKDLTSPLVCRDERRQYGWMLLSEDGAIKASKDAIRIASPVPGMEAVPIPKTTKRSRATMSDNQTFPTARARASEVPAAAQSEAATGAIALCNHARERGNNSGRNCAYHRQTPIVTAPPLASRAGKAMPARSSRLSRSSNPFGKR